MDLTTSTDFKPKINLLGLISMGMASGCAVVFMLGLFFSTQSAAIIPILLAGIVLCWLAIPCYLELVLMYPKKVGGIAALCSDAFATYNPILGNLAGTFYWCGYLLGPTLSLLVLAGILSKFFPQFALSVPWMATLLAIVFTAICLQGMKVVQAIMIPCAALAATIAVLGGLNPLFTGHWTLLHAADFQLKTALGGTFGGISSVMASLYLVAYTVPSYEFMFCYAGETKNPQRNFPRAMKIGAVISLVFFGLLPIVWLSVLGVDPLTQEIPAFASLYTPLFKTIAGAVAIWFVIAALILSILAGFTNTPRTLYQLAEDGLLPRFFSLRNKAEVPMGGTFINLICVLIIIHLGAPNWLVAATNFEYVLSITLPIIAVWLLRRNAPNLPRQYRASKLFLYLSGITVVMWAASIVFGFRQYGLPSMIGGLAFAFIGVALYMWRKLADRKAANLSLLPNSLHVKLSGILIIVLLFDAIAYLIAYYTINQTDSLAAWIIEDIFIFVALLTVTVGFILPGMVANAASEISMSADKLAKGFLANFSHALQELGQGNYVKSSINFNPTPVKIKSQDELGDMARSFNLMQYELQRAMGGYEEARKKLQLAHDHITEINKNLEQRVLDRTEKLATANNELSKALDDLTQAQAKLVESEKLASLGAMVAGVAHEVNTPLGISITAVSYFDKKLDQIEKHVSAEEFNQQEMMKFINSTKETSRILTANLNRAAELISSFKQTSVDNTTEVCRKINLQDYLKQILASLQPIIKQAGASVQLDCAPNLELNTYPGILFQVITILVNNSIMHGYENNRGGHLQINIESQDSNIVMTYLDDGKGIPSDLHKKIFEPFFTTSRNKGGVGLGLFVAYNKIIQIMKGSIECVDSPNGKGACFVIKFPVQ